ncbi:unnamed protein product [Caenorhabditis auriculariae]|uniref:F-box domain-containing protein n=1 Tax=Caenorhabditis auriculariae TaxID=2777116 RepID=A0A8S1HI37_9PELO|nr:unnamed protein product [Caenorhabditis auriculariae]
MTMLDIHNVDVLEALLQMMDFDTVNEAETVCRRWRDLIQRRRRHYARLKVEQVSMRFTFFSNDCFVIDPLIVDNRRKVPINDDLYYFVDWVEPYELAIKSVMQGDLTVEFTSMPGIWFIDVKSLFVNCCGKGTGLELVHFLPRFRNLKKFHVIGQFWFTDFAFILSCMKSVEYISLLLSVPNIYLPPFDVRNPEIRAAMMRNDQQESRQIADLVRMDFEERLQRHVARGMGEEEEIVSTDEEDIWDDEVFLDDPQDAQQPAQPQIIVLQPAPEAPGMQLFYVPPELAYAPYGDSGSESDDEDEEDEEVVQQVANEIADEVARRAIEEAAERAAIEAAQREVIEAAERAAIEAAERAAIEAAERAAIEAAERAANEAAERAANEAAERAAIEAAERAANGAAEEAANGPANEAAGPAFQDPLNAVVVDVVHDFPAQPEPVAEPVQEPEPRRTTITASDEDLRTLIIKSDKLTRLDIGDFDNAFSTNQFIRFLQEADFASECTIVLKFWVSHKARMDIWIRNNCRIRMQADLRATNDIFKYIFEFRETAFYLTFKQNLPNQE